MNRVLWALALSLVVSAASAADRKIAEAFFDAVGMEQVLAQSIDQMLEIQMQQNPSMAPYKDIMKKFFHKHMSYQSLKPELAAMYGEAFTNQELKDLIAFYRTSTGRKTITVMPSLMSQGAQLGMRRVQANMGELQKMIAAEAARLEGH